MNYANYVHLDVNIEPETLDLLEENLDTIRMFLDT